MRSGEVIELIEADGWYEVAVKGSHHQFRHPSKTGRVTVPHPKTEIPKGTLHNILKSAGLKGTAYSDGNRNDVFPYGRGIQ
ncbi:MULTISPECIES: type II toxin-antitoxin system HicA family toxin [Pseudomonas]|jgi:predicted RNA binding protein YcfA (HicA-like mRNA interferase family)|uniref:Type II toxin-antitoxin system HicA family toxin n=1 Tax=Pseudomonas gingeri TaxID=117681 RepID=A0A7Y8BNK8_9PSED|nr:MULTISPECIES: type II toxin-antitoxin system HicA family toxin [Pseudomonas]MCU1739806.1 type II toxin-antitoxin system HicA family toxin [Pseudomonas sp. 20S_6.2_Bac1]NWB50264.1 type II toxin-antitoxin system HicA family toxin [Pseudomonas gingeri]